MDNAQKAIMIGVGLFITIIIISAVMLITSAGQDMVDNSMNELGDMSQNLNAQLTAKYDGTVLTGTEVIGAVKSLYTKQNLAVAVKATTSGSLTNYGVKYCSSGGTVSDYSGSATRTAIGKLTDSADTTTYVPSAGKYAASLIKQNDVIVGVKFERK